MARLIRTAARTLFSSFSSSTPPLLQSRNSITSSFLFQSSRPYSTDNKITKSPLEANILRIIDKEIDYQSEYAPPHQTRFHSFTVEDQPGEQWMIMRGKYDDIEDIKLEVTMFDGYVTVPKVGDDATGEDVRLHISFIVDVSKGDGGENLEFLCSAWPDRLEIQKVYLLRGEKMPEGLIWGLISGLNRELQKRLREYLDARGVNDELSFFLHEYMLNKDRIELIQWFGKLESFRRYFVSFFLSYIASLSLGLASTSRISYSSFSFFIKKKIYYAFTRLMQHNMNYCNQGRGREQKQQSFCISAAKIR
uniref:Mitochondrial glycoprotein domain-containing protein n=1 Tax=Salix viminalis TaxID=40686 RepID=A0A6N2KJR6_SALVM